MTEVTALLALFTYSFTMKFDALQMGLATILLGMLAALVMVAPAAYAAAQQAARIAG